MHSCHVIAWHLKTPVFPRTHWGFLLSLHFKPWYTGYNRAWPYQPATNTHSFINSPKQISLLRTELQTSRQVAWLFMESSKGTCVHWNHTHLLPWAYTAKPPVKRRNVSPINTATKTLPHQGNKSAYAKYIIMGILISFQNIQHSSWKSLPPDKPATPRNWFYLTFNH